MGFSQAAFFQGPLPHPSHLREYEDILPGLAERLVVMAEKAQDANIKKANDYMNLMKSEKNYLFLGIWLAYSISLIFLFCAAYVGINENNTLAGLLLGSSALSGLAGVFVKNKNQ